MNILRILLFFALFITASCDLDKEIEVDIPEFDPGYVVEAYVMPDQPFGMLITKSFGYFDVFDSTAIMEDQLAKMLVEDVKGHLYVNGHEYEIQNQYRIFGDNPIVYNYSLSKRVKFEPGDEIKIHLRFPTGEEVQGETLIPQDRLIDSVALHINAHGEARSQTYFSTDSTREEFFRRQLFRIREGRIAILQDFVTDNRIASNGKIIFGSGYDFEVGDTLHSRVIHITKDYFRFFNSVSGSIGANANPFSQPGKIESNIHGSDRVIGIFTGMNCADLSREILE